MVTDGPIRDALRWEKPLSSPHVLECLVFMVDGAIFSRSSLMSSTRAGSYSIVVMLAVEPIAEMQARPLVIREFEMISCTFSVMLMI